MMQLGTASTTNYVVSGDVRTDSSVDLPPMGGGALNTTTSDEDEDLKVKPAPQATNAALSWLMRQRQQEQEKQEQRQVKGAASPQQEPVSKRSR